MSAKRANNSVYKLVVPDGATPEDGLADVIAAYDELTQGDEKYRPLIRVRLRQSIPGVHLDLYVRSSFSHGLRPFVEDYLESDEEGQALNLRGADACLFLTMNESIFAITSGSGYHIIANFVDYSFPFDAAKKLISNNFSAADVREMAGARTSRSETYRLTYSIDKSDAVGTVWKKLVGRLDPEKLPLENPLRRFIKRDKPPALEIKSSFVWRMRMSLKDVVDMIAGIEALPSPSREQLRELSFLDNLYPIKNDRYLTERLTFQFIENVRVQLLDGDLPDMDILDPDDIVPYNAGSNFKLGGTQLSEVGPPGHDDLVRVLVAKAGQALNDRSAFRKKFLGWGLTYSLDPDDESKVKKRKLFDYLHGQVEFAGEIYFRIDKVWYRGEGNFFENLQRNFIDDVFLSSRAIFLGNEVSFLPWVKGKDEGEFNRSQAKRQNFYFGDEIFAVHDRGKVELFDLLKVDADNRKLYIIQTKDSFGAKIRDACSQIAVASRVISSDLLNGKRILAKYYTEAWSHDELNAGITKEVFLSWFDYELVYVLLCSTSQEFTPLDFESNKLGSHIARCEILATKNELKKSLNNVYGFRLAHTRRKKNS